MLKQALFVALIAAHFEFMECQPSERKFANDHFVGKSDFKRLGTNINKWDSFSQHRNTQGKPSNTFVAGQFNKKIVPSLQNGKNVPNQQGKLTNLYQSNQNFRQVNMKRGKDGKLTDFKITKPKPFTGALNDKNRPIHFEGKPTGDKRVRIPDRRGGNAATVFKPKKNRVFIGNQNGLNKVTYPKSKGG